MDDDLSNLSRDALIAEIRATLLEQIRAGTRLRLL